MGLIARKHLNHGKNSEHLRTKSKRLSTRKSQVSTKKVFLSKTKNDIWKVVYRIRSLNPKTLKVDPEKLNELFNKTAERAVAKRNADNATLLLFISSLKDNQTALNFDSLL